MNRLAQLRASLKQARRRAAYWSGRMNFHGFGFSPRTRKHHDIEYETAMDDVNCLADEITELTGKRPATTDYREKSRLAFLRSLKPKQP